MAEPAEPDANTIVSLNNIGKHFGKVEALSNVNIDIKEGEIFALLGPSGCGKSTLLRIISGFENPTAGELLLDGKDMTRTAPNKRPVNMVFQSYAVFPHMSVQDNVAYGLKMEKLPENEINTRVSTALEQVHLEAFKDRMPDQLSGGQKQRVALARALVKQPRVLLLDEPLSALDAKLRDAMRLELVKLQETVGVTFIIVTHDQSEALAMADRVAVLEAGKLRQVDTPTALYKNPVDAFVADFIGTVHTFDVNHIDVQDNQVKVNTDELGALNLPINGLPDGVTAGAQQDLNTDGEKGEQTSDASASSAVIAFRPESLTVRLAVDSSEDHSSENRHSDQLTLPGFLGDIAFQGQHSIVEITRGNKPSVTAIVDHTSLSTLQAQPLGTPVMAHCALSDLMLLPNR